MILEYLKTPRATVRHYGTEQGQVMQKEYRAVIQASGYGGGQTKAHVESQPGRDVKCNERLRQVSQRPQDYGKRGPTAKWGKNTGDKGHRGATFKNPGALGPKEALEQGRLTVGGGSG